MADLADLANLEAELFLKQAIAEAQQPKEAQEEIRDCVRCGEVIPEARQKLRLKLCIDCAEDAERRTRV